MLGHELRNPLAPISTAVQLLKMQGGQSRELAVIERQVSHLKKLVDDLLDVSRITRGKVELDRRPIELWDAVARANRSREPAARAAASSGGRVRAVEWPGRGR
jgi:signal transduction histidine kinase